jgi:hypothetical protein
MTEEEMGTNCILKIKEQEKHLILPEYDNDDGDKNFDALLHLVGFFTVRTVL